ncbi:unnamed protein product [Allacma fusca]|uniref:Uncharacterized protein n=1 Tax=Allacma fusca TaxID=39272 RepID=A0A8J2KVF3_9HEXA|nr:unnamed protein product [Allacma fusca]
MTKSWSDDVIKILSGVPSRPPKKKEKITGDSGHRLWSSDGMEVHSHALVTTVRSSLKTVFIWIVPCVPQGLLPFPMVAMRALSLDISYVFFHSLSLLLL